jgi:glycosyltransferase involved in cell wall biosynthesis
MKVTVIIPYNVSRGYLEEAIESLENQTYDDIEILIEHGDCLASENFNRGLEKATGELVRYLCEDDLLTTNSIADTVEYFKNNSEVDFIHSNAINFFEDGTEDMWVPSDIVLTLDSMLNRYAIHGGTVVYRKRCFEKRAMDLTLWTGEEYDFNMWLLSNNYKMGYLNSFTYKYRRHSSQKSLGISSPEYQAKRQVEKDKIKNRYI